MAAALWPRGIIIKLMNNMTADEEYYREFLRFAEKFRDDKRIEIESEKNPGLTMCHDCRTSHPNGCPSCKSIWIYPDGRITLCPFDDTGIIDSGHDNILKCIQDLMNRR